VLTPGPHRRRCSRRAPDAAVARAGAGAILYSHSHQRLLLSRKRLLCVVGASYYFFFFLLLWSRSAQPSESDRSAVQPTRLLLVVRRGLDVMREIGFCLALAQSRVSRASASRRFALRKHSRPNLLINGINDTIQLPHLQFGRASGRRIGPDASLDNSTGEVPHVASKTRERFAQPGRGGSHVPPGLVSEVDQFIIQR
jgi:hypothetical protein